MTELNSPMTKNMPDWNALFNQYAQKMDNAQNTLDQLKWTRSTDGLVPLNGFKFAEGWPNYYETAQSGGKTLVHLTLHLNLTKAVHGVYSGDCVQVPTSIEMPYTMQGVSSNTSVWGVSGPTQITLSAMKNEAIDWLTGDALYTIDANYMK